MRHGRLLNDGVVVKSISNQHMRSSNQDNDVASILPIESSVIISNNSGVGNVLRMDGFLLSDRDTSRISIPRGTFDITLLNGDYRIDALPDSPTDFNYVTPSGKTGTLPWTAVGLIPTIRIGDPYSVTF